MRHPAELVSHPDRRPSWGLGAASRGALALDGLSGLVAALSAVAVGHAVAAFVAPLSSPLLVVGATVIDASPQWLKAWAIGTFGDRDKEALLLGVAVTLAVLGAAIGLLSRIRTRLALSLIGAVGLGAAALALSRPLADVAAAVPSVAAGLTGVAVLGALQLVRRRSNEGPAAGSRDPSRRRFLAASGLVALGAAASGAIGSIVPAGRAASVRSAGIQIPDPVDAALAVPPGVDLRVPELQPFRTPTASFYRVDTALEVPVIDPAAWRLRIHGMVDREVTLSLAELLELPLVERDITLACVSNPVGGGYVGNARWTGVPLATVLDEAGVHADADQIVTRSVDGMTIGTPTAVALDGRDALLAVTMNGEPLPPVHGAPVRMIVPGLYGYVSATKWLVDIELTTFAAYDPYWVQRGWAEQAPIRTMTRIDTPRPLARLAAGEIAVAGVAWAPHRGIERVETRVDDGPWQVATLAAVPSPDTWRQWVWRWTAEPGRHRLEARATDGAGDLQSGDRAEPFPSGATGWHSVVVTVE